jgi:hypothetical protein
MRLGILNSEPQIPNGILMAGLRFPSRHAGQALISDIEFSTWISMVMIFNLPRGEGEDKAAPVAYIVRCLYNHIVRQIQLKILKNWDVVLF